MYVYIYTLYFHGSVGSIMAGFLLQLDRGIDLEICIFTIPSLSGYFQMIISNYDFLLLNCNFLG